MHKILPNITLYYKISQYYFVLQNLHKTLQYTQQNFTHNKYLYTDHFYTILLHMTIIYTHRNFYTETFLHTKKILLIANFYTHFFNMQ